jgi:hypothetical protein
VRTTAVSGTVSASNCRAKRAGSRASRVSSFATTTPTSWRRSTRGARKLEYLAESLHTPAPSRNGLGDQAAETLGSIDKQVVDELDRLRRVVHELEKAYEHDERFEMNLAELRGITERIADLIENRNVALGS